MLAKFSRYCDLDGCLDILGRHNALVSLVLENRSFFGKVPIELKNDGVHDHHPTLGNSNIRVNLLENLVDLGLEVLLSLEKSFLGSLWLDCLNSGWSASASFLILRLGIHLK